MSVRTAPYEGAAQRMGISGDHLVQELGYDEDVDFELRDVIEEVTGEPILDEHEHEVVDAVLLWWRDGDGDLVDAMVDSLTDLDDGGVVWLLTPKLGEEGHVSPVEIQEAAPTAGLHTTSTVDVSELWSAVCLQQRKRH